MGEREEALPGGRAYSEGNDDLNPCFLDKNKQLGVAERSRNLRIHWTAAPSLVVWGEDDRPIPPVYAQEFGAKFPTAEVLIIPKSGHEPPLEQPEILSDRVALFLAA